MTDDFETALEAMPKKVDSQDIAVFMLCVLDTYRISAEECSAILAVVHGTYLDHKRLSAMN